MTTSSSSSSSRFQPGGGAKGHNASEMVPRDWDLNSTRSEEEKTVHFFRKSLKNEESTKGDQSGGDGRSNPKRTNGSWQPDANRMRHSVIDDSDDVYSSGIDSDNMFEPLPSSAATSGLGSISSGSLNTLPNDVGILIYEQKLRKCMEELEWTRARLSDRALEVDILEKHVAKYQKWQQLNPKGTTTGTEGALTVLPNISRASSSSSSWRDCPQCLKKDDVIAELYDLVSVKGFNPDKKGPNDELALPRSLNDKNQQKSDIDFDQVIKNVSELNRLVCENERSVEYHPEANSASFQQYPALSLDLYANGFYLDGQVRFRFHNEPASRAFLKDLADGYFPAELQGEYPDGVTLLLTDKRDENGPGSKIGATRAFGGLGRSLEGTETSSGVRKSKGFASNSVQPRCSMREVEMKAIKSENILAPLKKSPSTSSLSSSKSRKSNSSNIFLRNSREIPPNNRGAKNTTANDMEPPPSGPRNLKPLPTGKATKSGSSSSRKLTPQVNISNSSSKGKKLMSSLPSASTLPLSSASTFRPKVAAPFQDKRKPRRNSCHLKVMGLAGFPLILELVAYDTVRTLIGLLRNQLQLHRQEGEDVDKHAELQMFSSFPRHRLDLDVSMTLGDLGLLPRAVLHVVLKPSTAMR
ncbi:hypothetical protein TCAL_14348 [Tigriopus californicus]|uniref:SEP domain-containing protein n=2 Tax=Tigriopus californicus TaxID=6832 RepID=A0A553NEM7_TIGCA|nr:hypothetical protein TCAL_14348 [Tigriopus californicus]